MCGLKEKSSEHIVNADSEQDTSFKLKRIPKVRNVQN